MGKSWKDDHRDSKFDIEYGDYGEYRNRRKDIREQSDLRNKRKHFREFYEEQDFGNDQ